MRILQLTSDWKWTGPAQPMLLLARALAGRGHDVRLACPEPPGADRGGVADRARDAGMEPALALERARGVRPWRDARDARRLRALVEAHDVEIVHAWHTRDHVLAVRAARARRRDGRTAVVRSFRSAETIAGWPWNRWLFGPATDGLWCPSDGSAGRNARLRGGRPVAGGPGAVELARYATGPAASGVRAVLGLAPEHRVVGIVARAQPHRRFDLLLAALARAAAARPELRLLVVGRGTRLEELVARPAERLGVRDRVCLAGYRTADYVEVLRAMDVFTFLVPGSDGTCRALLEAAACGLPAVTSRRGALPEIVVDGETGLLVDETPDALAAAWLRLLDDASLRERLGAAARARAEASFAPTRLAADLERLYDAALASRR